MRLIDAEPLRKEFKKDPRIIEVQLYYARQIIDKAPTVEAFTREELENWLSAIAFNNLDGVEEDKKFADHCEEIIRRLDGFGRYVKDKREGKI